MFYLDAIIIGAGQSGIPLAMKLSKAGIKTALIEKRAIGGTCVNDGCTPTKTLIASAENAYRIKHSEKWGIKIPDYHVDFNKVMARKNEIVKQFRESSETALKKAEDLIIFEGKASFTGPKEIIVKTDTKMETIQAGNIFIDAGTKPDIPKLEGLDKIPFLTTTSILDLTHCPEQLVILGGNYNGIEMAQLFARLGSKVTIVEKSEQLLPDEDPDIAQTLQQILEEEGIRVYTGAKAQSVKEEPLILTCSINGRTQQIIGSHLLVATGRKPQTAALALDKAGIQTDEKGFIIVNDYLETNIPGIFAMGDIKGGPAFTHISYNDHLVIYNRLMKGSNHKYFDRQVPYCMFTDPQLGRIGITETHALTLGKKIKVYRLPMKKSSRGIETGQTDGFMKAVVEEPSGLILGAAILSAQGGEIMSVLQIAMSCGFTADRLKNEIFAHPLYSESINNLFMS